MLKASVDFYGPCREVATNGTVPLLALAGEEDSWRYPARASAMLGKLLHPAQLFDLHTFPGVAHDFDCPGESEGSMLGHPHGYSHNAVEESYTRVKAFLDKYLGSSGS